MRVRRPIIARRYTYWESAATFLANSGLVQVSAPADLDTATVEYRTASAGSSRPAGLGALIGCPLLTPDEAMRLLPDRQVLLRPGKAPALARKLRHYADPEFAGLADR